MKGFRGIGVLGLGVRVEGVGVFEFSGFGVLGLGVKSFLGFKAPAPGNFHTAVVPSTTHP